MLSKLLALLFVFSVSVAISVATMIYGWGLQPKSWAWIIGAGVFANIFVHFIAGKLMQDDTK